LDDLADVPSPIDFRSPTEAEQWAATAMAKRPWREEFFRLFATELEGLRFAGGAVLELGSGPGFLAHRILESLPQVDYTALDFSPAMHALAEQRLGALARRVRFVESDFTKPGWHAGLSKYDAVVTLQAVHELRHKRHAVSFYEAVGSLLLPGGVFLVCDHVCGEPGATNTSLYMSLAEHRQALHDGGFVSAHEVRREGSLVLYRAKRNDAES
jgi:SAM-dependent methyltransferase